MNTLIGGGLSALILLTAPTQNAESTATGVLVQYRTPEQEYREREERYKQNYEDNLKNWAEQDRLAKQGSDRGWGAIAYSPSTGESGYSERYTTRAGAVDRATRECGHADCRVRVTFEYACGALAVADNEIWSGQSAASRALAEHRAQLDCESRGGQGCEIITSVCSPKR